MSGKRSRSGCLTCRRRHHKCDESKPTCFNCRLRGVECEGYGITLSDFTACDGFNGQMVSKIVRGSPRERSRKRLKPMPEQGDRTPEAIEPSSTPNNDSGPVSQDFQQIDPIATLPDDSSPSINLTSMPTQTQTPNELNSIDPADSSWWNNPSATPSILMDLPPVADLETDLDWELPDLTEDALEATIDVSFEETNSSVDVEEGILALMDKPVMWSTPDDPFDQYLFSHYIENLSLRLYPVKPDQNPYRVVYGTLAAQSPPLLKTILFASAFHLSNLGRLPKFALQPYRDAMRKAFRDAVVLDDQLVGVGATVLLSIVFDVIGSGLESWSSKLIACRHLLRKALARNPIDSGLQCMIVQYNWAAIMSRTLLRGVQSVAVLQDLECIDNAAHDLHDVENVDAAHHQSHWWQNLPDHRMHLILREATELSMAVDQMKTAPELVDNLLQLMPQAAELINKIKSWHPDTSQVDPEYVSSVQLFNTVWRQGMLCYVYHEIYALPSSDDRIQNCVEASVASFSKLSWLQACLFPVFITAIHAQTKEARACFEDGLMRMHTSLAFQTPVSVVLVLKNIWEVRDNEPSGRTKWRDIAKQCGSELNILL